MRKIITFMLLIVLVSLLCLNGYATEYSDPLDSRNVPQEVLDLANPSETDVLFRYYQLYILGAFIDSVNIEEILTLEYTASFYALEKESGRRVIFISKDDGAGYEAIYNQKTKVPGLPPPSRSIKPVKPSAPFPRISS